MPLPQAQVVESSTAVVHVTEEVLAKAKKDADKKIDAEKQRILSTHKQILDQLQANYKDQITAIRHSIDSAVSKHKLTLEALHSTSVLQSQREHDALMAKLDREEREQRAYVLQRIHSLNAQEAIDSKQWANQHANLVQYLHLRDNAAREHDLQKQEITKDWEAKLDYVKDDFASKASELRNVQWKQTNTVCACVVLGGAIGWLVSGSIARL